MIKPTPGQVVVKPDTKKQISEGGIIIPPMAQKKDGIGTVIAIGEQDSFDIKLNSGDKILYATNAGTPYTDKGVEYLIIREQSIFFKFDQ